MERDREREKVKYIERERELLPWGKNIKKRKKGKGKPKIGSRSKCEKTEKPFCIVGSYLENQYGKVTQDIGKNTFYLCFVSDIKKFPLLKMSV